MIIGINDKMIVKRITETKTKTGLIMPHEVNKDNPINKGEVTSIGKEVKSVGVGDIIAYNKHTAIEVEHNEEKLWIVREENVYTILT